MILDGQFGVRDNCIHSTSRFLNSFESQRDAEFPAYDKLGYEYVWIWCDVLQNVANTRGAVTDMVSDRCVLMQNWVVVSNVFYFHPYLGKIPNLTNIFQRGWNHQLEKINHCNDPY